MKKILVIGAGFLQDPVILKAKELGYYTIAIDGSSDAVGLTHADKSAVIDIVNEEACFNYARNEGIDGVLTAATDYGILSASYVAERLHLPGLNYQSAKMVKNKYEVCKRLTSEYVDDTQEAFEVSKDTDLKMLDIHYPVMVKPCDGSGSRGAKKVYDLKELSVACKDAIQASRIEKALVETFYQGQEYGAESLVVNGEIHVLGVMKKWMTDPPYYAELGHQMPSELTSDMEKRVVERVAKAIEVLGINHGAVNMDLIIGESGDIHIVDVGARMGGNMIGPYIIPVGTGIDYMKNLIRTALGEAPDWKKGTVRPVVTRLLAFKGGIVKEFPDFPAIESKYDVKIYHHMRIGDIVNEYHTNLDGFGYIVASNVVSAELALSEISACMGLKDE